MRCLCACQVSFSTPGYEHMIESWLQHSTGLQSRSNFIILMASREYVDTLMERGITAYDNSDWMDGWGTGEGLQLQGTSWIDSCKALFAGWATAHGFNVLSSGIDVVFLKDPFKHVCNDVGIEIQSDIMLGGQSLTATDAKVPL